MSESGLSEGRLIGGRYRLERHLGEGGMGSVWAAIHTVTRRSVAMKFLKDSVPRRPELRQRFLREAAAASALKHPNVVEILDVFDFEDSCPVMVMELLSGETLGEKLTRDERLGVEETAAIMLPVVSAVGTAHGLGIVHRDLKPENLFLEATQAGTVVKVLDFGIAKLTVERYQERGLSALLTDTGAMLGTPCYMAPEQASGDAVADHRADIWSIGVILYECLSGTRPIEGEHLAQVVSRLMSAAITPLDRLAPQLPPEVAALVMQMLSREPSRRPESLHEVSSVLARYARQRAPEFGAPSTGAAPPAAPPPTAAPQLREPPALKGRVVAGRGADPQGATLLSSPPVGSTVNVQEGLVVAQQAAGRRRGLLGALTVLGLLGLFWLVISFRAEPEERGNPGGRASALTAAAAPPAPPVLAAASAVPAGAPPETPPPSTATPEPGARPALHKSPTKVAPAPAAAKPPARPRDDDDTLFSGRQ